MLVQLCVTSLYLFIVAFCVSTVAAPEGMEDLNDQGA